MTTTKQSWLKRSLAVLLAVMMVMSAGIANVFAAEKTTLEQLQDLIAYADTLEESNYTPESWKTFKEARDTIIDPTQIPERFQQMALEKLQGAIDQLVPVEQTDLEKLQSLLQKIDSMDSSLYTEESWNKLMDARKQIVDPTQIPDRFLANTISMLQSLVDGLVLKEGQTTQFDITVSEMQNGVVSTDVDKAAEGAIVTITVTPEPGFELKSITVMDESSKAVEVNDNKFKMPASNVFITAEFSKKEIVLEDGTYMAHFSGMDGYIYTRLSENIKILADDGEYTLTFYLSPGDTWLFEGDMYSNKQYMQ